MESLLCVFGVLLLISSYTYSSSSDTKVFSFPSFEKAIQEFKITGDVTTGRRVQKDVHKQLKLSEQLESRFKGPLLSDLEKRIRKRPISRERKIENPEFRKSFLNRRKALLSDRLKFGAKQTEEPKQNAFTDILTELESAKDDEKDNQSPNDASFPGSRDPKLISRGSALRRVAVRRRRIKTSTTTTTTPPPVFENPPKRQRSRKRKKILRRRKQRKPTTTTPIPDYLDYLNDYFDNQPEELPLHNPEPIQKLKPIPVRNHIRQDPPKRTQPRKLKPIPVGGPSNEKFGFGSETIVQPTGKAINSRLNPVPVITEEEDFSSLFNTHQELFTNVLEKPQENVQQEETIPEYEYDYLQNSQPSFQDYSDQASRNEPEPHQTSRNALDGFRYGYKVDDSKDTGNFQSRTEKRDGKTVSGTYEVALPDGRIQVVNYVADSDGFRADVSYVDNKNPSIPAIPTSPRRRPVKKQEREQHPTTPSPGFQLTPKPLSQTDSRHNIHSGHRNSHLTPWPVLESSTQRINNGRRQRVRPRPSARGNEPNTGKELNKPPAFPGNFLEPFLTTPSPVFENGSPGRTQENIDDKFLISERPIIDGRFAPRPKPIGPIHHREVARIPPNPFLKKLSKNYHRPIQPSPKKLSASGHFENPFGSNFLLDSRPINRFPPRNQEERNRPEIHQNNLREENTIHEDDTPSRRPSLGPNEHNSFVDSRDHRRQQVNLGDRHRPQNSIHTQEDGRHQRISPEGNLQFSRDDESASRSRNPFSPLVNEGHTKTFNPPPPPTRHFQNQIDTFDSQRHDIIPPLTPQNLGLIDFNPVTGNFELIPTTPSPIPPHNPFFNPHSSPLPENIFFIPSSTPLPNSFQDTSPLIFQYSSNDGAPSPPLFFDPNQPVFLSSLGNVHPIPLLLPLNQGFSQVNRTRRRGDSSSKPLEISESELFLNQQDIYPEPNGRVNN